MMILCPNHHGEADALVIDDDQQRAYKAKPFNVERGFATGQLTVKQMEATIDAGSVRLIGSGPLVEISGETLLDLAVGEQGTLLLSARLYDSNDQLLAVIRKNVWKSDEPLPWDIEFAYRRLTIRNRPRKIALEIDARKEPVRVKAQFWRHGQLVEFSRKGVSFPQIRSSIKDLTFVGGTIGYDEKSGEWTLGPQLAGPSVRRPPTPTPPQSRNSLCWCGSGRKFKKCHGSQ